MPEGWTTGANTHGRDLSGLTIATAESQSSAPINGSRADTNRELGLFGQRAQVNDLPLTNRRQAGKRHGE